ncbi:hypothetical protein C8R42DRAFT_717754 [Lentinula raphanica]|nr:hypothetical protein C8R42DRAFT_717754 [Lentinula raphanica]
MQRTAVLCGSFGISRAKALARLMEETPDQRESLVQLVLPFVTVPFRYPSAFAPANHFRSPLRSAAHSSSSTPFSIPDTSWTVSHISSSEPLYVAHSSFRPTISTRRQHYALDSQSWKLLAMRRFLAEKEYQRRVPIDIPVLIGAQLRSHRGHYRRLYGVIILCFSIPWTSSVSFKLWIAALKSSSTRTSVTFSSTSTPHLHSLWLAARLPFARARA